MVKHNNIVPNAHFHKDWQRRIKCFFDQPAKKKSRRLARAAKAAAVAPRPVDKLRPVVRCPTIRYNRKVRVGRGFSLEELAGAGISRKYAKTVGITVDTRRRNKSVASKQTNVARLKDYLERLVVFPRGSNQKPRGGDSDAAATAVAAQISGINAIVKPAATVEFADLAAARAAPAAYKTLRAARAEANLVGPRWKKAHEDDE